jgi:acetyl-CoA C-acetyltransferase
LAASELAVILSACRTAIANFGGTLKEMPAADLGAIVVQEAIARAGVSHKDLGEVVLGCVLQAGQGMNVARQAAIKAGVPIDVPAETVNRVCGSGLTAVVHAVEAVRIGYTDIVAAGGTESMSTAPFVLKGARWGYRMGHAEAYDEMILDGLTDAMNLCHMGITAEEVAARYNVSRQDQDAFAADSQRKALEAIEKGAFNDEIVPVVIPQKKGDPVRFDKDEYPRAGTTAEKLGALKAAFKKDGCVTAGNASGINDGAAAVIVSASERASALGKTPLARILSYATVGVDPMQMGMGPVPAVRRALERAQLTTNDIALYELNEAFAAQSLAVVRELGIDQSKVNVNGGAIALGHPIGASGARILTTLIYALKKRGGGKGVAALCIGGGQGVAMVIDVI